jgi:hypothetical protein
MPRYKFRILSIFSVSDENSFKTIPASDWPEFWKACLEYICVPTQKISDENSMFRFRFSFFRSLHVLTTL